MNADLWTRIQELFVAAADLPMDQRAAYLDKACPDDPLLRAEVESLLANDGPNTQMIASAVRDTAENLLNLDSPVGKRLGAYRITRELGHGGMGAVYLAVRADAQYHKEVAIKLVRTDCTDRQTLDRFRAETQILAGVDHPNIARLLDAGATPEGRPYLVMEYVNGQAIDRYCQKQALSAEKICELFCQVCDAVSYAHRNLIIHRDLKPGNILVTADGVPKLLDFGIAKLLTPPTSSAVIAAQTIAQPLTPDYASPEQVRGDPVTTATDVYQLGTLLFELLTGRRPHRIQTYTVEEIARVVCLEEIVRPSEAPDGVSIVPRKRLRGDLDNIVLMALRKEPERRYQSAEQFREDVIRHLKGLPVLAREDTLGYRAGKFLRRNRLAVAAAAVVFLSLVGGIAATEKERRHAEQARIQAESERRRAEQEHQVAERNKLSAEAHAREAESQRQRAEQRLRQLLELANKSLFDVHSAIATLPGATEARRTIVSTTLDYLDSLSKDESLDPELLRMTADGYLFLAEVQGLPFRPNLGQPDEAMRNYAKADAIVRKLREREPDAHRLLMLTVGINQAAGATLQQQGKRQEAGKRNAIAFAAARRMAELAPNDPESVLQEAIMNHQYAMQLVDSDPARAMPYARRDAALHERVAVLTRQDKEVVNALGSAHLMLGRVAFNQGRISDAIAEYRKAVAIREKLRETDPDNVLLARNLLVTYRRLADAEGAPFLDETGGDPAAARGHYQQALAIAERLQKADARDRLARSDFVGCLTRVGIAMTAPAEREKSLEVLRRAVQIYEATVAADPKAVPEKVGLALAYEYVGRRLADTDPAQALTHVRRSLQLAEALPVTSDPAGHVQILADWEAIASVLAATGDRSGALAVADRYLSLAAGYAAQYPNLPGMRRETAKGHLLRGMVFETLARRGTSPPQRMQDWTAAKSAFERSRLEGEQSALAPPAMLAEHLAECDQEIRKASASR
jgi:tetratricopeptide (TPR) repeat protein